MSKPRTGTIFTQDILQDVTKAVEAHESSAEQAEDVFRRKIHALQRFLQHGMSRFSVETLQNVLFSLSESDTYGVDDALRISSLREIRTIVKRAIMKRDSGSFRTSDVDSLHYIELFLYCVYCMSEAKRLFELLYEDLYYSYYNPDVDISRQNTRAQSASTKSGVIKRIDGLTEEEHYSQFGISTLDLMTGSTQHKLKQTVQDMKMVLNRWTDLLTEDVLNPQSFDPESEQDLVRLHGAPGIEPVLRLVPDMFAKYYKCLELAKQWWKIAHEIYTDLPFQRRPSTPSDSDKHSSGMSSVTLQDMSVDDDNESTQLDNESESNEVTTTLKFIHTLNDEIEVLERREEKFEVLMETYNKVVSDIDRLQSSRNKLLIEQEYVKAKGIPQEIAKIEAQIISNAGSIKLLEFQQALLFEDYVIHSELRPSIIRFLHDAKSQLSEAQHTLMTNQGGIKDQEQTEEHHSNHLLKKREVPGNRSQTYHSEYSLQSIERGVQAVSDKCMELEQENTITRVRKESLSKLNKRHSQRSLQRETSLDNNKNNKSLKTDPTQIVSDYNNNTIENKGTKSILKSNKNVILKEDTRVSNRKNTANISSGNKAEERSEKQNASNTKLTSVAESNGTERVLKKKNDKLLNSETSAAGGQRAVESEKRNSVTSITHGNPKRNSEISNRVNFQGDKRQVHKPKTTVKEHAQIDKNNANNLKTANKQEGTGSKNRNPQSKSLVESKGSSGSLSTSKVGKEYGNVPPPRPPLSTQIDIKRVKTKIVKQNS